MANPQIPSLPEDNKSIVAYNAPPAGFDILTATDGTLRSYGIPRKPDALKEPRLLKLWERAFSSNPTFVKAELITGLERPKRKKKTMDMQPGTGDFGPQGWAGLIIPVNGEQTASMIYGEWTVPGFAFLDKPYYPAENIGIWIGIDDWPDVLQAGTASTVTGENVTHSFFTEWYANDPIFTNSLQIDTGDYMIVMICYNNSDFATCTAFNKTKNLATTLRIYPPDGVVLSGNTVEWVMEVEGGLNTELPNFNPVTINNCIAWSKNGEINLTSGGITEIWGNNKADLTASAVNTSVVIEWMKEI